MNYPMFYSELGKLLYAITKADGRVQKHEYEKLKDVVMHTLAPHEIHNDKHGTDAAYYAEIEFDFLEENFRDVHDSFDSFVSFVERHKTAITPEMLQRIRTCTRKLAEAYRGITRNESTIIKKLDKELKRIFG